MKSLPGRCPDGFLTVTPAITAQEYFDRRAALVEALPRRSVALLAAAELKYRSGAVFFPFRQESNFLYLTGFCEPDALAVIRKGDDSESAEFHLFARPKDPKKEQWMGPWSGLDAATDVFNADCAYPIGDVLSSLPRLLGSADAVYTDIDPTKSSQHVPRGVLDGYKIKPLAPEVHNLRAIKSRAEVVNMRKAGQVSGRAITEAMRTSWESEKDLAAYLDYAFTKAGCDGPAYIPVVAGGKRGLLIHYVLNNAALRDDEMLLVDAGGEYGTYITDISRTWPHNGKFAPAQRDLYEAVLRVQRTSVALCRADAGMSLEQIHKITAEGLRTELGKLGFDMSGDALSTLFPHHVGHYVGLDVHDTPGYPRNIPLRAGHCITIEPGVYVPDTERWPEHFRGMAIRIEDSVCVQEENPFILTTEAVKEVDDIQALRG